MLYPRTPGLLRLLGPLMLFCFSHVNALATETLLHNFTASYTSGRYPVGQLAVYGGQFYGMTRYGINNNGSIFKMTSAGLVTTLHEFSGSDGAFPNAGLIYVEGNFYGVTPTGGTNAYGNIFQMTPSGALTILHSFTGYNASNPPASDGQYVYAGLTLASDGNLYGVTEYGGANNQGTVFMLNPSTGSYSIVHSFNQTSDTVAYPVTGLTEGADGALYGALPYTASPYSGGLYKLNKDGSGCTFLHGFYLTDPAGYYPQSDLISASDGNIYGTCYNGGANGLGTIFRLVPSTGSVTPLWAFDGYTGAHPGSYDTTSWPQSRLTQGKDGNLYGVTPLGGYYTQGTAFRLSLAGVCTVLTDFSDANALAGQNPLVQFGTSFYFTSAYGGITASPPAAGGYGAACSISSTGATKLLQSFYQRDTYNPRSGLVQDGSYFYGTCYYGGEYGDGAIYKTDSNGHFTIIHHLDNSQYVWEGSYPVGGLLLARDGNFYGTCFEGGRYGYGTLFKVTSKGALTVIHHFQLSEGDAPVNALVQGVYPDNNLYGVLTNGGTSNAGTIFCTDTAGKNFKVIHYFTGSDGLSPSCTPLPDGNGYLYGTASNGGSSSYGTLWKVSTDGSIFTKLFDFDNTHGANPIASGKLTVVSNVLYGIAVNGGANSNGVIFQTDLSTQITSVFHSFNNSLGEGYYPNGGIVYDASSGNFYGCCGYGGSGGDGTVYKINLASGALTVLHSFTGYNSANPPSSDGANPMPGMILGTDGLLYGVTLNGGRSNDGTVFQQTTSP